MFGLGLYNVVTKSADQRASDSVKRNLKISESDFFLSKPIPQYTLYNEEVLYFVCIEVKYEKLCIEINVYKK